MEFRLYISNSFRITNHTISTALHLRVSCTNHRLIENCFRTEWNYLRLALDIGIHHTLRLDDSWCAKYHIDRSISRWTRTRLICTFQSFNGSKSIRSHFICHMHNYSFVSPCKLRSLRTNTRAQYLGHFLFVLIILSIMLTNNSYSDVGISWYSTRNRIFFVVRRSCCTMRWPLTNVRWVNGPIPADTLMQQLENGDAMVEIDSGCQLILLLFELKRVCSRSIWNPLKTFFITFRPLSMRLIVTTSDLLKQVKSNLDFFDVGNVHRKSNMLQQKQFHIIRNSILRAADASSNQQLLNKISTFDTTRENEINYYKWIHLKFVLVLRLQLALAQMCVCIRQWQQPEPSLVFPQ